MVVVVNSSRALLEIKTRQQKKKNRKCRPGKAKAKVNLFPTSCNISNLKLLRFFFELVMVSCGILAMVLNQIS